MSKIKHDESKFSQWDWKTTTIEVPKAFANDSHQYLRVATHQSFSKINLALIGVDFFGDEVYNQLQARTECEKYRKEAVDETRYHGNFREGMYWKQFPLNFQFENKEFQESLLYVINEVLISRGVKKRDEGEKLRGEKKIKGSAVVQEDLTSAGILATVFEEPQPPHMDVKKSTLKYLKRKGSPVPWSGILPLLHSGSRLICYGSKEATPKDPVILNIPPRTLLLFG